MHNSELIGPSLFAEMGLALPLMYFQAMQLIDAPLYQYLGLTRIVLGIGLQFLHCLAMYLFTKVGFPQAWAWFAFGVLYWVGIGSIMHSGVPKAAAKSRTVYRIFRFAALSLFLAQVSPN
jgi:hypothetical protein